MVMQSKSHQWNFDSLKQAKEKKRYPVPRNEVKAILDVIKRLNRRQLDDDVRESLIFAGLELNKILLK